MPRGADGKWYPKPYIPPVPSYDTSPLGWLPLTLILLFGLGAIELPCVGLFALRKYFANTPLDMKYMPLSVHLALVVLGFVLPGIVRVMAFIAGERLDYDSWWSGFFERIDRYPEFIFGRKKVWISSVSLFLLLFVRSDVSRMASPYWDQYWNEVKKQSMESRASPDTLIDEQIIAFQHRN